MTSLASLAVSLILIDCFLQIDAANIKASLDQCIWTPANHFQLKFSWDHFLAHPHNLHKTNCNKSNGKSKADPILKLSQVVSKEYSKSVSHCSEVYSQYEDRWCLREQESLQQRTGTQSSSRFSLALSYKTYPAMQTATHS